MSEVVFALEDEAATEIRTKALDMLNEFGVNLLSQQADNIKLGDLYTFIKAYGGLQETDPKIKKGFEAVMKAISVNKELRDFYSASQKENKERETKKSNKFNNLKREKKTAAVSLRPGLRGPK